MSILETSILQLSSQGFFCNVFRKGYLPDGRPIPFFEKHKTIVLPAYLDTRDVGIKTEQWEKIFKLVIWERVDKVAIWSGINGVLAFDFDVKHFAEGGKYENKEKYDKAWKIWKEFKEYLEKNNIQYYCETSKSKGEHLIVLCELDVENLQPKDDICPGLGVRFIECFAFKKTKDNQGNYIYKSGHLITIAPSDGYIQQSKVYLTDLQRISASEHASLMSYFDKYQEEEKRKKEQQKKEQQKQKKLEKQEEAIYRHNLTLEEIREYIRHDYDVIYLLEMQGHVRYGDRMSIPGKSDRDIFIMPGGQKIWCHATAHYLYNNGKPCDALDILSFNGADIKKLYSDTIKKYAPYQMTSTIENAETIEELYQAINETCKERIALNIYQSKDRLRSVIEVKTRDGEIMFFNNEDFLGHRLEQTAFSHFASKYLTNGGSFSPLKRRILNEIEQLTPKVLLETSSWQDGRFYSNSSEECRIEHQLIQLIKDDNVSFQQWKTQVFDVAVKSNGTALAILMGFAAPFVDLLHQSFGINFVGDSNIGKTMALRIAKGMFVNPTSLESWRGTPSALELQKVFCANSVLCLDEMLHADENALASIMQLCGVTERKRCSWDGTKLNMAQSNDAPLLILSSSEVPFLQMAKRFHLQVTKGQLNRFLDFNVTKDDFLSKQELTQLYASIKKTYGVAIKTLCDKLEFINADLMISEFTEFSNTFTEQLKSMPSASQRVLSHLIFLKFIAKQVGSLLNIDAQAMMSKAEVLFDRCLESNAELFADGDAIEIEAVKEKLILMIGSGKYSCRNESGYTAKDETCFYSDYSDNIFCYTPILVSILKRDLNLSDKKIWSIFKTLDIFGVRRKDEIKPLGRSLNIYPVNPLEFLVNPLEFLGLTDIKVNNPEDTWE